MGSLRRCLLMVWGRKRRNLESSWISTCLPPASHMCCHRRHVGTEQKRNFPGRSTNAAFRGRRSRGEGKEGIKKNKDPKVRDPRCQEPGQVRRRAGGIVRVPSPHHFSPRVALGGPHWSQRGLDLIRHCTRDGHPSCSRTRL